METGGVFMLFESKYRRQALQSWKSEQNELQQELKTELAQYGGRVQKLTRSIKIFSIFKQKRSTY